MAIVQISRITNRKGLSSNLPQLAGAELGWSTDTRQLYIGNGTLAEGAPAEGNTEILTEFSDIMNIASSYTYKGSAAGYIAQTGPTAGSNITLTLQAWMDQWCSVKDFGAKGDGSTDDTDAINRALKQIYCIQSNVQVRRAIFFPAGIYRVTKTILIPTYATLYGDGPDSSIIFLDSTNNSTYPYVARTADSLQQFGPNIGNNGATTPKDITISNMGFENSFNGVNGNVLFVQNATNCSFTNCIFMGGSSQSDLTTATNNTSCVSFESTIAQPTSNITFQNCEFAGTVYGVNNFVTSRGITITNSNFNTLYRGVLLNNSGVTGSRITQNIFDNIYAEGILFDGGSTLNASAYNIFYNVGSSFNGLSAPPSTSVISITTNNNLSVSDLFARNSSSVPFVQTNLTNTISIPSNGQMSLGTYVTESGNVFPVANATGTVFNFNTSVHRGFIMNYSYTLDNGTGSKMGTVITAFTPSAASLPGITDTSVETATSTNIVFSVAQTVNTASLNFSSASFPGKLSYTLSYFK